MNPVNDPPGQDGGGFSAGSAPGGRSGHGRQGNSGAGGAGAPNPMGGSAGTDGASGGANGTVGAPGAGSPPGGAQQAGSASQGAGGPASQIAAAAGERLVGKLTFIDNAIDTSTQTVQLKASFDNANGHLWAGQFTATSLHLFDEDSALVVPTQAIVNGQRGTYVYVVDQADTARQRGVVVERQESGLAIIASGIREGDRVVTDGQSRLTPDSPVHIRGANDMGGPSGAGNARRGRGRGGRGNNDGGGGAGAVGGTGGTGGGGPRGL